MKKVINLTLTLDKNAAIDFAKVNVPYNVIKVGDYTFTMKRFRIIPGHDDSLPYMGTLCINNKPFAVCGNDGWGGPSSINVIRKSDINKVSELDEMLNEYEWYWGEQLSHRADGTPALPLTWSVDMIADTIAESLCYYLS